MIKYIVEYTIESEKAYSQKREYFTNEHRAVDFAIEIYKDNECSLKELTVFEEVDGFIKHVILNLKDVKGVGYIYAKAFNEANEIIESAKRWIMNVANEYGLEGQALFDASVAMTMIE